MKIVRLGMTETELIFLTYIIRYQGDKIPPEIKKHISKFILNMVNWLYTTSGYYDKSVKGDYFNFDVTAINKNYTKYLEHLAISVEGCEQTQIYVHDGLPMQLFHHFKEEFSKHFNISNLVLMNGTKFYDRIDSIFDKMNGRKVLAISSFDGLIQSQYSSGNIYKIYDKFPRLAGLSTVKFPYCYFNNGPDGNYFETLDAIFEEIRKMDFDIALLGCGAYGHMLCHRIHSELNKDAIYIGGSIQTIFGILSKREKDCSKLYVNKYWITEIPEEYKPANYKSIEDGCYW
jgi:hypothetical protein